MSGQKDIGCGYPAAALTIFQRPIGVVQSYVVACRCGWESQHTSNWPKSLDAHIWRSLRAAGSGGDDNKGETDA